MSSTPGDIVKSQLANDTPDPDTRPATPEPTTSSGVKRGRALYDTPPKANDQSRKANIWDKSLDTRRYNAGLRARIEEPPKHNGNGSGSGNGNDSGNGNGNNNNDANPEPLPESHSRQHGKKRTVRDLSRSPTPGSTDHEPDPPTQQQTTESQYTYVYETLDHEGLVKYAEERLRFDLRSKDTQAILTLLRLAEGQQASQVGPARQPASIGIQQGSPLQVGGGWHLESTPLGTGTSGSRGAKRGLDAVNTSNESNKRPRVGPENDTATESETEDEEEMIRDGPARVAAHRIIRSCSGGVLPAQPQPPVSGTHAPPPTRKVTPATVLESPPSRNQSFGASLSQPGAPMPPLPMLLEPPRGPVHARLRAKALKRYVDRVDRDAEAAEAAEAEAARATAPVPDEEVDELEPTDTEEVPETELNDSIASWHTLTRKPHSTPAPAPQKTTSQRTYGGTRSHAPPASNTNAAAPGGIEPDSEPEDPEPIARPNSPNLTAAELIRRERTRAVAAKVQAELRGLASGPLRPRRLFAEASQPPVNNSQTRPPPGATADVPGAHTRGTRRLDPVSAARADMINFNKAAARDGVTGFIESVTRHSEHTARCQPPASRPADGLLEDDEELLAQAEAFANSKWPSSSPPSRGRNRKKKPLARDVSGIERQVLIMAKIHLFVYALVEGVYQTRATFLRWALAVYYATWIMELPDTPYVKPPHEFLEIMVNNLATARGKTKEAMRPFVENVHGFMHRLLDQQAIQDNLDRFSLLYPNNFHCTEYCPRKGHYESPELAHAIAVTFFQGPSSAGMMYPDYFRDMPLTVIAFVLAIWQFCIEEWSNGWHQRGDLGMAAMREKYEGHLAGLKELRDIAPKRVAKLQKKWREYVEKYSGISFTDPKNDEAGGVRPSEMRPDTPEPDVDAMSVEELDEQLFETARQESLRDRMREIIAREEEEALGGAPTCDDDDEPRAETPHPVHSRSPSPAAVEFNEHGRLTARAKGKGRAR
ncbi:hypothetical protein FRC08_001596 [Ceratobasidium sp. 394]|nr:hypothetical protein FRC08_001596 [Ceratobasidium sp. 394]